MASCVAKLRGDERDLLAVRHGGSVQSSTQIHGGAAAAGKIEDDGSPGS